MKEQKDLDQMLESFLRDNNVEDAGFTQAVMQKVTAKPKIAFITNLYPMLGALFGLLIIVLTKQSLSMNLTAFNKPFSQIANKSSALSSQYSPMISSYGSYYVAAGLVAYVLYITFKKEKI